MIEMDPDLVKYIIEKGKRLDKRKNDEYRPVTIETNAISSAEGSARVKIGNTDVIAGVKMGIGQPFEDRPDEGVLMVNAELVPLAAPNFEAGPPKEDAVELARVVDRTIRESKAIDLKKLSIKNEPENKKVWIVAVDIDVLDHDGNLIDASCLAATAALKNTKIPELDKEENPIYDKKGKKNLPLSGLPVATTFVKIGNIILADPTYIETNALDARLTVGTVDVKGKILLSAMQKGGSGGFSLEEVEKIIDISIKKGNELRKMLK